MVHGWQQIAASCHKREYPGNNSCRVMNWRELVESFVACDWTVRSNMKSVSHFVEAVKVEAHVLSSPSWGRTVENGSSFIVKVYFLPNFLQQQKGAGLKLWAIMGECSLWWNIEPRERLCCRITLGRKGMAENSMITYFLFLNGLGALEKLIFWNEGHHPIH